MPHRMPVRPARALTVASFDQRVERQRSMVDRVAIVVLYAQWLFSVGVAHFCSQEVCGAVEAGRRLQLALFAGGALALIPTGFLLWCRGGLCRRIAISAGQIGYSTLLIWLTSGRHEAHFHVFLSLALIGLYRDGRLVVFASLLSVADHFFLGSVFPSVLYGVEAGSYLRPVEFTVAVALFNACVLFSIAVSRKELHSGIESELSLQNALREADENLVLVGRLKVALDHAAIVTVTDVQGRIIEANGNFEAISGYSREEILGRTHRAFSSGFHSKEFFGEMWNVILSGSVWKGVICNRAKDGSFHWLDTKIVPIRNSSGEITEFVSLRMDITNQKMLDLELRALNESLEQKVQEKTRAILEAEATIASASKLSALGEMAGGIAHEINNPLMILTGKAELIQEILRSESPDFDKCQAHLEAILRTIDRIARIIRGMRAVSRNAALEKKEVVRVEQLVEDVLSLCQEKFRVRGMRLISDVESHDLCLSGNLVELSQVLLNLLNNAFDAATGTPDPWVKVRAVRSGGFVEISVTDSGPGISGEIRGKIFEPFFTTKEPGKGTGLGLSISSTILKNHGGDLALLDGANTCFRMRVPTAESPGLGADSRGVS